MTEPTLPAPETRTLERPGATLTYDVRGDLATPGERPVLLLVGSPMGADGFPSLAAGLTDRVVVTYDPRGAERSCRSDGGGELTPDVHGEDLAALVAEVRRAGATAVDVFASSGGAVNALALVTAHPDAVGTLVAHEPPLCAILPDAEHALAAVEQIHVTYLRDGWGAALAGFIALTQHRGEVTDELLARPYPEPAAFGLPGHDDGSRDDALLGQNLRGSCRYQPDAEALRAAGTRIVVAVGEDSATPGLGAELARRGGEALAGLLSVEPAVVPGGHNGFQGGEFGMPGRPVEFAARLREILDGV
ncbi:alpha/beta fold hydrolase [Serinibacter arcticus]|uniref:Putative hydrolases or acyltransferases (Alpha/beta hydrolase superfamily) n=1 Tax=Serinibacter arcticus TaxID=1655435 RepID=A0A4Z1DWJ4_9MICO|nr:alpha/beta hydrolase [Serinibacter arcticus]TGO03906.1 putative hydrolases or acyltransferases (alpha/beta hydrolase superfamily) [Serinibacter arcticus]